MEEQRIQYWNTHYREQDVEKMPWFAPELDHDFIFLQLNRLDLYPKRAPARELTRVKSRGKCHA